MPRYLLVLVAFLLLMSHTAQAQQALPVDQLKKIKAATVFIKVTWGNFAGSGSGFVVHTKKDECFIVSNQHVIIPPIARLRGEGRPSGTPKVEIVFHSGTTAEFSENGVILVADEEIDLSLLRVTSTRTLPEPLNLVGPDKLPETTPVYVCGFPFGENLAAGDKNPEISIGQASVSSNRTNTNGEVVSIQLNGALNPGNSGGPVVTQDGKLVGVAVRTVTGAGLGFAVPPAFVRSLVNEVHFLPPTVSLTTETPKKIRVDVKIIDPLGNLRGLKAHVAVADNLWKADFADNLSELPGAKAVTVLTATSGLSASCSFAPFERPTFWIQYSWSGPNGTTRRSKSYLLTSLDKSDPATTPPPPPPPPNQRPFQVPRSPFPQSSPPALVGPDGKPLPALATVIPPTPRTQMDVDELNQVIHQRVGQKYTVDILTSGVGSGYQDGPSFVGMNRARQVPGNIDFVVSENIAEALALSKLQNRFLVVRITGTVKNSPRHSWKLFVADEVGLLGEKGDIVATYKSNGKFDVPPILDPRRATPQPQPFPPPTVRPFNPEPYPLGSARAQEESYSQFTVQNQDVLGKTYKYSVVFFGALWRDLEHNGRTISGKRLISRSPATGKVLEKVSIFAPEEVYQKIWQQLGQQPSKQLPCVFEFKPVRFVNRPNEVPYTECLLISASMEDAMNPGKRIVLEPNWQNHGIDIETLGGNAAAVPAGRQPELVPEPQPRVTPPAAVPAPLPKAAAPVANPVAVSTDPPMWAIPVVLLVGVGIAAGLYFVIQKSNTTSSSGRSVSSSKRPRREEVDDEDDDRPSRRSRRRS